MNLLQFNNPFKSRLAAWLALPKWYSAAYGCLLGVFVAALPYGVLYFMLEIEKIITPNCAGSCFSTGFGWVLIFSLVASIPWGIFLALAGCWGSFKFLLQRFKD